MFAFCCLVVAVTPVAFDPEHLMLKEDQLEACKELAYYLVFGLVLI